MMTSLKACPTKGEATAYQWPSIPGIRGSKGWRFPQKIYCNWAAGLQMWCALVPMHMPSEGISQMGFL